jgi:hypothetical protein
VNSTEKFNYVIVKVLKPILSSSHDGVPLTFKKKTWRLLIAHQYGSFEPGFSTPVKYRWTVPLKGYLSSDTTS